MNQSQVSGPKKYIAMGLKVVLAAIVMVYLGLHTINFFNFTFPPDQQYLSWLGFGLTGGGLIVYLIVFLWDADTDLKKTVALIMTIVCGIGEVLAAGFGMQIEAWARSGWTMTQQDFDTMLLAIRALAFAHFLALVIYIAGDNIGKIFEDKNHNHIPDFLEKPVQTNVNASDTRQAGTIRNISIPEDVYKQLLIDADIRRNGHVKAEEDFTNRQSR